MGDFNNFGNLRNARPRFLSPAGGRAAGEPLFSRITTEYYNNNILFLKDIPEIAVWSDVCHCS